MNREPVVVAEYDYYTLDQARKIIETENRKRKKENIETYLSAAIMVIIPVLYIIDWIIFGY